MGGVEGGTARVRSSSSCCSSGIPPAVAAGPAPGGLVGAAGSVRSRVQTVSMSHVLATTRGDQGHCVGLQSRIDCTGLRSKLARGGAVR